MSPRLSDLPRTASPRAGSPRAGSPRSGSPRSASSITLAQLARQEVEDAKQAAVQELRGARALRLERAREERERAQVSSRERVVLANQRKMIGLEGARHLTARMSQEAGRQTREDVMAWREEAAHTRETFALDTATRNVREMFAVENVQAQEQVVERQRQIGRQVREDLQQRHAEVLNELDHFDRERRERAETARLSTAVATVGASKGMQLEKARTVQAMRAASAERQRQRAENEKEVVKQRRAGRDAIDSLYSPGRVRQIKDAEALRKARIVAVHMEELDRFAERRQQVRSRLEGGGGGECIPRAAHPLCSRSHPNTPRPPIHTVVGPAGAAAEQV